MNSTHRLALALFRLLLLYGLFCFLLLTVGLEIRRLQEDGWQLNSASISTSGAKPQPPFLGINVELSQVAPAARSAMLARLGAAGFGWARQRFDWGEIEPRPGQFAWTSSDVLLRGLRDAGLQPVVVLDGSPAWARAPQDIGDNDNPFAPPADPASFARFAAAFAHRYQDQVIYYQIWDEPNIAPHWGNRHIEPINYAQLLKAAARAIRHADSTAFILTAALAPTRDRGHTAIDERYFLQRLYAAGAGAAFDALAVQPFGFGAAPSDPRERIDILNFQRIKLLRRVMLAAGDGATPIWAVRFGWNTRPGSPWGTVSPANQRAYAVEALTIGYQQWPWLAAMGWMIDQPAQPNDDPFWGFALTAGLEKGIGDWIVDIQSRERQYPIPNTQYQNILLLLAATVVTTWRFYAAVAILPWSTWVKRYHGWPLWLRFTLCAGLLTLYYFATWPPLIGLCWLLAAMLLAAQPRISLYLAAFLLPFHDHHKEIQWVDSIWTIAPAHAALLCLLPGFISNFFRTITPHSFDWLAVAWLCLNLLSSSNVWYWPGYWQGLTELALAPLLFYSSVRMLIRTEERWQQVATALSAGGLVVALLGLITWSQGQGVAVDGVLRLAGPYYSPNQAALYLERTLWLASGLGWATVSWRRWGWWGSGVVVLLALLLTASRGGLLLALPIGVALWLWLRPSALSIRKNTPLQRGVFTGLVGMSLLAAGLVVWIFGERLANSTTIISRFQIWYTTLDLWQAYPWLGVGPGGFFWRYPAFLLQPTAEPNLYHPHNLWLEFAAIWGIGGVIWLAIFLSSLVKLFGTAGRNPITLGLAIGLAAGLAHAQVDTFTALPDLAGWNWLAVALLVQKERVMPQRHDPDQTAY